MNRTNLFLVLSIIVATQGACAMEQTTISESQLAKGLSIPEMIKDREDMLSAWQTYLSFLETLGFAKETAEHQAVSHEVHRNQEQLDELIAREEGHLLLPIEGKICELCKPGAIKHQESTVQAFEKNILKALNDHLEKTDDLFSRLERPIVSQGKKKERS